MLRLKIRVEFAGGHVLGPGKIHLLELIAREGSIRGAAIAMGMSYRRAWLLLHELEAMMGRSVIAPETGGVKGGGSTLTELGHDIILCYRAIEKHAARASGAELRRLTRMAGRPASTKTPSRRRRQSRRKSRPA